MKKTILIFFGAFFLLYSCKKDDAIAEVVDYGPDIKEYCYFKIGTWWVYEDSLTGNIDSVYVTDSFWRLDTITAADNVGYTGVFEYFNVVLHSSYHNNNRTVAAHSSNWQAPYMKKMPRTRLIDNSLQPGLDYTSYCFLNPHLNNYVLYNYYGQQNYIGTGQFISGSLSFNDVSFFETTINLLELKHKNYYGFVKNVGLVSNKILPGGTDSSTYQANWKLKSYNIVQQ
jgi:hypothetical protein